MRRGVVASVAGLTLVVAVLGVALGHARAETSSADAVRWVQKMRSAPGRLQFSGVVRVTWPAQGDHAKVSGLSVGITDDMGAIEVQTGQARVYDQGARTYFKNRYGWSSALVEPDVAKAPAPDHRWVLVTGRGPDVAARPTRLVEVRRRQGAPAERLYLDTATGLLLRRDVLDPNGRLERSLSFTSLDIATVAPIHAPSGVSTHDAQPLASAPSGYVAPSTPGGYVLVARSRHPNGVELLYSDGLFTVSVLEQQGDLDWGALPAQGVATTIDGTSARRYSLASADVVVWERNDTVFTVVSDAPRDVIDGLLTDLAPGRSAMEKVVDYVLGPFGWD
ncbi:MAG TPA: hypothetical protein VEP49_12555 [Acidimicrobiia bacterium]|nr:hypothetical protein [Acidimicrobiia bacterium]